METIGNMMEALCCGENKTACKAMRALQEESLRSAAVYPYMDRFLGMLGAASSYVRTRGLVLAAANARWDAENKLDGAMGEYLAHIGDEKAHHCPAMREGAAGHCRGKAIPGAAHPEGAAECQYRPISRQYGDAAGKGHCRGPERHERAVKR